MTPQKDVPSLEEERDAAVEKVREELRALVRSSRTSQRRLEEMNGYTEGYLSQVLNGRIVLTARHVLGVLLALGVAPASFFERLFPQEEATSRLSYVDADEIRQRLERYDAALQQLEEKGILTAEGTSPDPAEEP